MAVFPRRLIAHVSLFALLWSQALAPLSWGHCAGQATFPGHKHLPPAAHACTCDCCHDDAGDDHTAAVDQPAPDNELPDHQGCPGGCAYCNAAKVSGCLTAPVKLSPGDRSYDTLREPAPQFPPSHPGKLLRPPRA